MTATARIFDHWPLLAELGNYWILWGSVATYPSTRPSPFSCAIAALEVVDHWYGLFGVNWFHFARSATDGVNSPSTGLDLVNVPISGVAGEDVATVVAGIAWKPTPQLELASGFEFPVSQRTDTLQNRVYMGITLRY